MADNINAAGYETKPWWPYVRSLMEGGGSVTVEQLNVTENGTYTAEAGKAYSPVVVNVEGGSSDFSTAEVTITNNTGENAPALSLCIAADADFLGEGSPAMALPFLQINNGETKTVNVILYNGTAMFNYVPAENDTVTGDITATEDFYFIAGNGTITMAPRT